jgi:L-lactate dehydrogenase complex protein LldG
MSKEEILTSIRANLAASAKFDELHAEHRYTSDHTPAAIPQLSLSSRELKELFRKNLESVRGRYISVASQAEAVVAVQKIIDEIRPDRIALSDASAVLSMADSLSTSAEVLVKASAKELFSCEVGLTSAQWAIAETGTLVLESAKEFNRLTSLVPERHICILESDNIRGTMSEILSIVGERLSPTVTFITGPSRTSDIELTLAIGVHGPAELYVIVVERDPC